MTQGQRLIPIVVDDLALHEIQSIAVTEPPKGEHIVADPADYCALNVPVAQLALTGLTQDNALIFTMQIVIPAGVLALQKGGRVLNQQGVPMGLDRDVREALSGVPPLVRLLIKKAALADGLREDVERGGDGAGGATGYGAGGATGSSEAT